MTLSGGAAAKRGYLYQDWWTLLQFIKMLDDSSVKAIQIEPSDPKGVEFTITTATGEEFHQTKYRYHKGNWSLAALSSNGVLEDVGRILGKGENTKYAFVSGSSAEELSDLRQKAQDADSLETFEGNFLRRMERAGRSN